MPSILDDLQREALSEDVQGHGVEGAGQQPSGTVSSQSTTSDRKRPRRRARKLSNPEEPVSSSGQIKGELYVEFPGFLHVMDLKSHLERRIGKIGDFTCEKLPKSSGAFDTSPGTIVRMEFTSKNMAKRAVKEIRKSNKRENMIILKYAFNKRDLTKCPSDDVDKSIALQKIKSDMDERALVELQKHDVKIEKAQKKLSELPAKNINLSDFDRVTAERKALEHKVKELQDQRKEFCMQVKDKILAELEDPKLLKNFDHSVTCIRLQLGVEITRLEKAFPIYARRQEIVSIVLNNSVCVVLGETGSGKSTQMPQYLCEAGLGDTGMIACTQPRKVAATSLGTHVASEMASNVGQLVGYRVGMRNKTSQVTKIVYVTDHILLNEILTDPKLRKYSCVIVDEAHERSIYTDLLLGMLKKCLEVRPELRVVITSATIDPEVFVRYFNGCPVLKVSGRTFPVDVVWPDLKSLTPFQNHLETAARVVTDIHEVEDEGDILVFLTSPIETEKCCARLQEMLGNRNDYKCLQLHGKLQAEEQQAVFEPLPGRKRKIVCATNSAETSVTIPGIKYVVDSGLVKEMRYDPKKGLSSLDIVVISKSSAEQRKGRAGRMSSGKCFRLYAEEDFEKMETGSLPEILRINLAQALLKLLELGVDPLTFEFVQSPSKDSLKRAMEELEDIDASRNRKITELGKQLSALPFGPRLGKLALLGIAKSIGYEAVSLAALTTMGFSLFYRSGSEEDKNRSDLLKTRFCHPEGDHLTMLNVYREWFLVPEKEKSKWCVKNSINAKSLRMVRETANEVVTILKKNNLEVRVKFLPSEETEGQLKHIIFHSSKKTNLAMYLGHPKAGYIAAAQWQQALIHPSSSVSILGGEPPEWVVFEQLINTSRDFLTVISPVDKETVHKAFLNGELKFDPKEIEKTKVTLVLTRGLGQMAFGEFVGRRFCNLKKVEEEVVKRIQGNLACVDADRGRLTVQIHVSGSDSNGVAEVMDTRLLPVLKRLRNGDMEIRVAENSACVRAVLGSGGNVNDLLFGSDYRNVYIEGVSVKMEVEEIERWLSRYGVITDCSPVRRRTESQSSRWGTVTFRGKESAQQAVAEEIESDMNRILPCLTTSRDGKVREFTLKLTWTRRALKGFGFLYLANIEDMPALLYHGRLVIDGQFVKISLNKKDRTNIYMKHLPQTATEEKVIEAVRELLLRGDNAKVVDKVVFIRESEFETTEIIMESLKQELLSEVRSLCSDKKLNLSLPLPNPKAANYTGFLHFTNPNDGVKVYNAISSKLNIHGKTVYVQQDLSTTIFVPKYMFCVLKIDLEDLERDVKVGQRWKGIKISPKQSKAGHVYVSISSENTTTLASVKKALDSMLAGQRVDVSEFGTVVQSLFRKEGRQRMDAIQNDTSTIIRLEMEEVRVIGTQENRQKAIAYIEDYLRMLGTCLVTEFGLNTSSQPRGLMKRVLELYDIDMDRFRKETGLEAVELDFRKQILKVTGTQGSLKKALDHLNSCAKYLQAQSQISEMERNLDVDCVVCFCPITEGQLRRLNLCGHPYCLDCTKHQVQTAVDNRDLPLQCALEDCKELWCWKDVEQLVAAGGRTIHQLVTAAMGRFIAQHKDLYHYCITADCPVIFPLSSDGKLFVCEVCQTRICTSCKVQYHDGLTCAMYQSGKKDPGLSEWMNRDKANNKLCPKCTTPIEKDGGCLHMTCLGCNTHICWVCMKTFLTSQECYNHLGKTHHRFGDEYPI